MAPLDKGPRLRPRAESVCAMPWSVPRLALEDDESVICGNAVTQ